MLALNSRNAHIISMPMVSYSIRCGRNNHTGQVLLNGNFWSMQSTDALAVVRSIFEDWMVHSSIDIYSLGPTTTFTIHRRSQNYSTIELLSRLRSLIPKGKIDIDRQLSDI